MSFGDISRIEKRLDQGFDVTAQEIEKIESSHDLLFEAVAQGYCNVVKLLLDRGADINILGGHSDNSSTLRAAVEQGHLKMVELLLERGADVNAQGVFYGNALQAAVTRPNQEIINMLLERGADVNAQGGYYGNALQAAVRYARGQEIINLLLERGADVNAQGGEYGNALQAAVRYARGQEIINLLLERGADVNAQGGEYGNALQAAAAGGYPRIVELLLNYGADVTMLSETTDWRFLLYVGVRSGSLAVLETVCGAGADIHLNTQDDSGLTPLHTAVDEENVALVKYLLERGASPNLEDFGGNTPLQLAIRNRNRGIVLLLYPKTTVNLSSITASDLRRCSGTTSHCHLEMISSDSTQVAFNDESLFEELDEMSYPLSFSTTRLRAHGNDFMNRRVDGKQML